MSVFFLFVYLFVLQSPSEYLKFYKQRLRKGVESSDYHGYAYDGVWVMALAIDKVISGLREDNELYRFDNFDYEDEEILNRFSRAMNETNFRGVTVRRTSTSR